MYRKKAILGPAKFKKSKNVQCQWFDEDLILYGVDELNLKCRYDASL